MPHLRVVVVVLQHALRPIGRDRLRTGITGLPGCARLLNRAARLASKGMRLLLTLDSAGNVFADELADGEA
jgi:hypothetical protein